MAKLEDLNGNVNVTDVTNHTLQQNTNHIVTEVIITIKYKKKRMKMTYK